MFESTLEAQGLHEGDKRYGTLSAALLVHAGIAVAVLAVGAIIVPPVITPERQKIIFVPIAQIPLGDLPRPQEPRRPPRGSGGATAQRAIAPPHVEPVTVPRETPSIVETTTPEIDTAPTGSDTTGTGGPIGSIGSGTGDGDKGDGSGDGTGVGSGPQYLNGEMKRPVLLVKVEPQYPETARQARLSGKVIVQAVIAEDGSVESVEVLSSKNPIFNAAALDAVRKWRYSPAQMNGQPVRVFFTVVVEFVIH